MGWNYHDREITNEEYEKIQSGEIKESDFFSDAEIMGYGAVIYKAKKADDGRCFIPYGIASSCD